MFRSIAPILPRGHGLTIQKINATPDRRIQKVNRMPFRRIHNIKLVQLHDVLHSTKEAPLKLHGIQLHHQVQIKKKSFDDSPAYQILHSYRETKEKLIIRRPVYAQYGPLFENVDSSFNAPIRCVTLINRSTLIGHFSSGKGLFECNKRPGAEPALKKVEVEQDEAESQLVETIKSLEIGTEKPMKRPKVGLDFEV